MYSRILAPLDGSELAEQVLPYTRFLAKRFDAEVEILRVLPAPASVPTKDIQAARRYARLKAHSLEQGGVKAASRVVLGDPISQIIIEANLDIGTMVVMSTRGEGGLEPGVLGSVVDGVLQGTSNPLFIVRSQPEAAPATDIHLDSLIVPLDGSPLAEFSLPHVIQFARTGELQVHLVRATPIPGRQELLVEYPNRRAQSTLVEVDEQAKTYLDTISKKLRKQGVRQIDEQVLHGDAAVAIVEFAQQVPNNLVVMTTHGSSGIGTWPLGSVTQLVECHCETPVLVSRPDSQYYSRKAS